MPGMLQRLVDVKSKSRRGRRMLLSTGSPSHEIACSSRYAV